MIRLLHLGPRPTYPSDVRTRYQTTGDSSCAPEMLTLFKLVNPKATLSPLFFSGETTVQALDWSPFPPPSADCSTLAHPLGNYLFSGSHQLASLVPQFPMNTLYFKTVRNWLHVTIVEAWEDEEWEPWSKSPLVFALLCVPALFLSPSESRFTCIQTYFKIGTWLCCTWLICLALWWCPWLTNLFKSSIHILLP